MSKLPYTLLKLEPEHLGLIVNFLKEDYFDETIFSKHLTYSRENSMMMVHGWLTHPQKFCLGALTEDNQLVGFNVVEVGHTHYQELEMDSVMFVIRKDHRGTGLSRELVKFMDELATACGAKVIYTPCASGLDDIRNDGFWQNLFKKFKFVKLGTTMAKFKD